MNKKLYVGNLSYDVTSDQLDEAFSKAGKVISATVITDKYSGRSKGFGFVEVGSDEEAKKAIEMYNGKDFQGRKMIVNEARPRQPREFSDSNKRF
ncbi:RNA-binding protein [Candidatus Microgenomates bacterium]|nr:RNA-binding protein [Candidatus Microgenomates bacterium]